jgi:hypothetical protein
METIHSTKDFEYNYPHQFDYLYRCYDKDGTLLYIALTSCVNLKGAQEMIKQTKHWYDRVAWVEVEKYQDLKRARAAKIAAIKKLKPIFNKEFLKAQRYPDAPWPVRSVKELP